VNASAELATVLTDELIRCGLREAVLAPGSRSAPLAFALHRRAQDGDLRLHVRVDERSAAFAALGMARASRLPAVAVCTSGTAAAHFHAAVIEADQDGVPLLVLTADRPPELRGTGANQTVDQLKLYGTAVRWFCEVGVADEHAGRAAYWRSLACRAWAMAAGLAGGRAGPVHLNLPFREPLVPAGNQGTGNQGTGDRGAGRPGGAPWTAFTGLAELPWTERGLIVCGHGDYDPRPLLGLAGEAGWPVLAEPSSNARQGPNALTAYQYLLAAPGFAAAHQPDLIISAGRPGLSRGQLALLRAGGRARHLVLAAGGDWSDPVRSATDVAAQVRLADGPRRAAGSGWLAGWLAADEAARRAVDAILDGEELLSEPALARGLAAGLPAGALLWAASSLPIRDLDWHLPARSGLRILASRGASGIDGMVSSAIGAALAHQAAGGGPAAALIGDLALLHDSPGLMLGPDEPRPDLCLIVANNDGGGIFSMLEQAAYPGPFERVFGTPHGVGAEPLAAAAGLPCRRLGTAADLAAELAAMSGPRPAGLRLAELRTDRPGQAALRERLARAAAQAVS
jgi:2-succinyl-5-enolpyruvyl-6-hydroxy-3-cyclohexene-1-carboxylate synthase